MIQPRLTAHEVRLIKKALKDLARWDAKSKAEERRCWDLIEYLGGDDVV